jgi:predicted kinase
VVGHVLVGGWPGSGKTTLARGLAAELGFAYLGKDEVKEALMDVLGAPADVIESRRLGRAATVALLRVARDCPAAVVDSTWFDYTGELVRQIGGAFVEVRCVVPVPVARQRYGDRVRDLRHLDGQREESELWGEPVAPLGVGPLIEVDTSGPVDVAALAARVGKELSRLAAAQTERA